MQYPRPERVTSFLQEPNAILRNFHIGRIWLKITIYIRLSESENYLKKRVLNHNSNNSGNSFACEYTTIEWVKWLCLDHTARWVQSGVKWLSFCLSAMWPGPQWHAWSGDDWMTLILTLSSWLPLWFASLAQSHVILLPLRWALEIVLSAQCPSKESAKFLKCVEQGFAKAKLHIIFFLGKLSLNQSWNYFLLVMTSFTEIWKWLTGRWIGNLCFSIWPGSKAEGQ